MQRNIIEPDDSIKILTLLRHDEYIKQEFDIYR